jgi:hypothetical protein
MRNSAPIFRGQGSGISDQLETLIILEILAHFSSF